MSRDEEYKTLDPKDHERMAKETEKNIAAYDLAIKSDKGISEKWYEPWYEANAWKKMDLPQEWHSTEFGQSDGIVWFRKEVDLPADVEGGKAGLGLGPIDDRDETYVNGKLIGSSTEYNKDRQYVVESGTFKAGRNVIVVKVTDTGGGGGMYGKKDQMFIDVNSKRIPLHGLWQYKSSAVTSDFGIKETGPNTFPSQLYNAMIAPLVQFAIKGVIWYQGEANTHRAFKYQTLFPALVTNWRSKWGYELPFFWVQLANFRPPSSQPQDSEWAELREAQSKTLSLPKTGQAVAIDIGVADDVHPRNKQDVGYRLALSALKVAYDKDLVYSGPVYKSMTREGGKMILKFTNTGGGLLAKGDKYGYVKGFTIAGAERKFVWAQGYIDGDRVIIQSDFIKDPVAARYGWADNPDDANLFNQEGLPASPFRTDNWTGIIEGN
jgi:sialate O-acetylesterase